MSNPVSSTPPWSLHQLLPPSSCSELVPSLTAFDDELLYGALNKRNPLFPIALVTVYLLSFFQPTNLSANAIIQIRPNQTEF